MQYFPIFLTVTSSEKELNEMGPRVASAGIPKKPTLKTRQKRKWVKQRTKDIVKETKNASQITQSSRKINETETKDVWKMSLFFIQFSKPQENQVFSKSHQVFLSLFSFLSAFAHMICNHRLTQFVQENFSMALIKDIMWIYSQMHLYSSKPNFRKYQFSTSLQP